MHDVGDGFRAGKLLRDDSCVGDFCDDEDEGAPVWVVVFGHGFGNSSFWMLLVIKEGSGKTARC